MEGLSLGAKLHSVPSKCIQWRPRWGLQRKQGLRGMWRSKRIEQVREIPRRGDLRRGRQRGESEECKERAREDL